MQAVPAPNGSFVDLLKLAQAQHGVFAARQASELGVGYQALYRAVSTGKLERDLAAVYRLAGAERTWESNLMAAQLWLDKPDACVSHRSAAALWRLAGFEPGPLELSASHWKKPLPPIVVHKLSTGLAADTTTLGPLRVTNPGRTLVDVAGLVDPELLERAVEDAIRRRLTTVPHLRWLLQGRSGKAAKGIADLRRAISHRGAVTESELEVRLLQAIRRAGLPEPVTQHEIYEAGEFVARVDFAYPSAKVAIEADSYRFHSGRSAWESDISRRNRVTALGWLVLHVTHRQMIEDMSAVIRRIRDAITPPLPS